MSGKRAIIVGASSGIGFEICRELARSGWQIAALARRADRLESLRAEFPNQIKPVVHDVLDPGSVPPLFAELCHDLDGLDLIMYVAGAMHAVAADEFDFEKDHLMVETNLLGAIAWLNQAAQRFQHTGGGTICAIGSVAGDRGRAGNPVYNASKAGLAAYMEALRNRLHRKGVTVSTIKPGPIETEMTAGLTLKNPMKADVAAKKIVKLAFKPGEHYLSIVHRIIFAIIRLIPSFIFRKLSL